MIKSKTAIGGVAVVAVATVALVGVLVGQGGPEKIGAPAADSTQTDSGARPGPLSSVASAPSAAEGNARPESQGAAPVVGTGPEGSGTRLVPGEVENAAAVGREPVWVPSTAEIQKAVARVTATQQVDPAFRQEFDQRAVIAARGEYELFVEAVPAASRAVRQALLEIYAALALGCTHNRFENH